MVRAHIVFEIFFIIKRKDLVHKVVVFFGTEIFPITTSFNSKTEIIIILSYRSFSGDWMFWISSRQTTKFSDNFVDFV